MFSETYRAMQAEILPSTTVTQNTLTAIHHKHPPRLRRVLTAAGAAAAALALAVTAASATWEPAYQVLYALSPAAAQFFQPVRRSCTDSGVTMEVVSVSVEGDTAQAYITLTGDTVDGTCDLYDSWDFHLPFDQIGTCRQVDYDPATRTATFLCLTQTMDGSPIPTGGKMTFSLRAFLSGKETAENLTVALDLSDYDVEAETASIGDDPREKASGAYTRTGGSCPEGNEALLASSPILRPQKEPLAAPVKGISITAAGYADGLFHVQMLPEDPLETDNHGWLWLEDDAGTTVEPLYSAAFRSEAGHEYVDFVFSIPLAELADYSLHGDFCTSSRHTTGNWKVTFPLRNS